VVFSYPQGILNGQIMRDKYQPLFPDCIIVDDVYSLDKRKKPVYTDSSYFKKYNVKHTPAVVIKTSNSEKYISFDLLFNGKESVEKIVNKIISKNNSYPH
jgi:hypothetical protein